MKNSLIYIAGIMRTGTTLLQEMLTCKPHSFIFHEPWFGRDVFFNYEVVKKQLQEWDIQIDTFMIDPNIINFLTQLNEKIPYLGVKEIRHVGWEKYPSDTKFILIGRNPKDIYLSCVNRLKRDTAWTPLVFPFSPRGLYQEVYLDFQRLKQMWNYRECLKMQYEGLCQTVRPEIIKEFTGIEEFGEIGDFHKRIDRGKYEVDLHNGAKTTKTVNRYRDEQDPSLIDEANEFSDLMQEYRHFWRYCDDYNEFDYWNNRHDPNDKEGTNTERHVAYIKKHINGTKKVLDFGCGNGRIFEAYQELEFVQGVDISSLYTNKAREAAEKYNLNFDLNHITLEDLDHLPYGDKEFDVAVAVKVLLHQRPINIIKVMNELVRIARKVIVISWMQDSVAFNILGKSRPDTTYCFHYNYPQICKDNNWKVSDLEMFDNQAYFVYE